MIWSYVFAYRSAGGHVDLRFCMPERRGRGGRGKCGCGLSFVHIEVLHGGWGKVLACVLPSGAVYILRRNNYKTLGKRNVGDCADRGAGLGGVGGGCAPPPRKEGYLTRLATQGRGGSIGLRPFRRGRGEERRRGAAEGDLELRFCMFERRR